jgi:single-stranded-DNA-specific exonuclease
MIKKWIYRKSPGEARINSFASELNIHPTLASILIQRGVDDLEKARAFFRPSLDQLHDPFLMKGMHTAVQVIEKTITSGGKILVYGDYDVDGTTAVSLMYGFLKPIYPNIDYYIPDRYAEGYGLSRTGLQHAIEHGYSLIITLDCGIKANDLVQEGVDNGLNFIICDHHLPGDSLPPATAILDAKQKGCSYPFKELTGCGVAFKLVTAFCIHRGIPLELVYEFMDLVAVSIAADIVPINGENRVLSYFGLRKLNLKPRPGFRALLNIGGINHQVDIPQVVFGLAPRINAAGRIDHARSAVELLLSDDAPMASKWADSVNKQNSLRKEKDSSITSEALTMLEQGYPGAGVKSTVLYKEDWHKGVIGIVASRCIEKYYRPTIILTQSQNKATGSARSVPGYDIYEAISECSDLLDAFGGHRYAAGLTLAVDKISEFQRRFEQVVSATITEDLLTPVLEIDQELPLEAIDDRFYSILQKMGPFGPENMQPVFVTKGISAFDKPRVLKEQHLKFRVKSGPGHYLDGVAFGLSRFADDLAAGKTFDVAYTLEVNTYRGERTLQIMVKDIKLDQ